MIGAIGAEIQAEVAVLAVGVQPNSELGAAAGIAVGLRSARCVNWQRRTNVLDVFAAGDCVGTWHWMIGRYTWLPLGTRVFELAALGTGLRDHEASASAAHRTAST